MDQFDVLVHMTDKRRPYWITAANGVTKQLALRVVDDFLTGDELYDKIEIRPTAP